MLIDWQVHINDPKYMGPPYWRHPVPMTLEHALATHELAGLDRTRGWRRAQDRNPLGGHEAAGVTNCPMGGRH